MLTEAASLPLYLLVNFLLCFVLSNSSHVSHLLVDGFADLLLCQLQSNFPSCQRLRQPPDLVTLFAWIVPISVSLLSTDCAHDFKVTTQLTCVTIRDEGPIFGTCTLGSLPTQLSTYFIPK